MNRMKEELTLDHFIRLPSLPADFRAIPADLADRFRYDEATQQLHFAGFMCKGDFDRLSQLSDSWAYKRAVEALFQLCTLDDDPSPRPRGGLQKILACFGLL